MAVVDFALFKAHVKADDFADDDVQLVASALPEGSTVTWASSATGKATVNNGLVHAVAAGSSNITASITVEGVTYTATCAVTVQAAG